MWYHIRVALILVACKWHTKHIAIYSQPCQTDSPKTSNSQIHKTVPGHNSSNVLRMSMLIESGEKNEPGSQIIDKVNRITEHPSDPLGQNCVVLLVMSDQFILELM